MIALEAKEKKYDPEKHAKRLEKIVSNWDEILKIISEELPEAEWLFGKMAINGMPMKPEDISLTHQDVVDAFVCSRDIRDKYLSGSMLWDLGELDAFSERL